MTRPACRLPTLTRCPARFEVLVARHGRSHGPFTVEDVRARFGVDPTPAVESLTARGELLIQGAFRPGGSEP